MSDNGGKERRTFLKLVGGSMVATGMASSGAVASEAVPAIDQSESAPENTTVSVRNRETGEVSVYRSLSNVDPDRLAAGEYEITERTVTPTGERIKRQGLRSNGALSTAADDEFDLVVQVGDETNEHNFDPYFSTGDTVPIWLGAVQEDGGVPVGVSGVALEVEILDPDGEVLETYEETTNGEGYVLVEHELSSSVADGQYEVALTHPDASDQSVLFGVGEVTEVIDRSGSLTPGNETTIGIYAVDGGNPISTSVDVSIDGPDRADTQTVETDGDGIGLVSFTPQAEGRYTIETDDDSVFLESRELAAYSGAGRFTNQRTDEPVIIDGHVFEGNEPASYLEIELTLKKNFDETVDVVTTTTDQNGQFVAEFDASDETTNHEISIETTGGQEVFSDVLVWIDEFDEETDEETDDDIGVDLSFDTDGWVAPGESVTTELSVAENGSPLVNESVTVSFSIGFSNVPYETVVIETDANGTATTTVTVPDAIDNVRFNAEAGVTVDGETVTDSASQSVQRYDNQFYTESLAPGGPVTVVAETTEIGSDDPFPDVDVSLFTARDHIEFETFDGGGATTGVDGTAEIDFDVPEDARRAITVTEITAYGSSSRWSVPRFDDLSINYDGPSEVVPGTQVAIEYGVETTEPNTAVVALYDRDSGYFDAVIVDEETTASFDLPSYLEDGSTVEAHINVVTGDGTVEEHIEFVSIADDGPEPPEGVSEYENDDGEVDTEGLRDAIDDWRNDDEVDTDLLREVIDAWRSS